MSHIIRDEDGRYRAIPSRWERIKFAIFKSWSPAHVNDRLDAYDLNVRESLRKMLRTFTDDYGQVISNVHDPRICEGRPCVIHNPTDHPLRHMKLRWRQVGPWDIKPPHFERICEHGVGHPDPDDMWYWNSVGEGSMGVHGCDGCCGD